MQMLFDSSEESFGGEPVKGLSVLPGKVVRFASDMGLKIPQIGWNELNSKNEILPDKEYVYFVHSYKAQCDDKNIAAYSEYGGRVPALVYNGKYVYGAQFHPEKSGETGLKILKSFGNLIK